MSGVVAAQVNKYILWKWNWVGKLFRERVKKKKKKKEKRKKETNYIQNIHHKHDLSIGSYFAHNFFPSYRSHCATTYTHFLINQKRNRLCIWHKIRLGTHGVWYMVHEQSIYYCPKVCESSLTGYIIIMSVQCSCILGNAMHTFFFFSNLTGSTIHLFHNISILMA